MWHRLVFTQYSYYSDSFFPGIASRICNRNCHVWVRYIDTTKIMVACMSPLLLSVDLLQYCYFIMFYFKLNNGAMVKLWMVKWCNGGIKIKIRHLFSQKYWICSFFLFSNTIFLQHTKQFAIFSFWSLTRSTATKVMLSNQATTKRQDFIRGRPICVRKIVTLI